MGFYVKAEPFLIELVDVNRVTLGEQDPEYAVSLNSLAGLYKKTGEYKKSELLYTKALSIVEKSLVKEHAKYSAFLNNLALLIKDMGSYAQAEPMLLEAVELKKKIYGAQDPEYAISLSNLASLYLEVGDFTKAEPFLFEALTIKQKSFGKNNDSYASSLNNLAELYAEMGNYERAEPLLVEALNIMGEVSGKLHPSYAISLNTLAVFYDELGNFARAESLLVQAIAVVEKSIGKQNNSYATYCNNLATVYTEMGKYEKAEPVLMEALSITEKVLGKHHPEYLIPVSNLAILYINEGKAWKAESLLIEALENTEKVLGKKNSSYSNILNSLAGLYLEMSNYAKAEPLFKAALESTELTLGKQHPDYGNCLSNLASLYEEIGQDMKAEKFYSEAHQNMLQQITAYFPGLSDKEKFAYYKNRIARSFEYFNTFVLRYQAQSDRLNGQLYNNVLATKALLFQSQNKIRRTIFSSGDTALINLYHNWQGRMNFLSQIYQMTIAQKQQADIDQNKFEEVTNSIEKQLSSTSELFAKAIDKRQYTWRDVQKKLKPSEAAVEMIRFQRYHKKWLDSIVYATLVITPTCQQPAYILISNRRDLEDKYTILYQRSMENRRDFTPTDYAEQEADALALYQQYWAPIARHSSMHGIKTVYFSSDGIYHQFNLNTLLNPKTKKYLIDEVDIHLVSSTRDLLTEKEASSTITNATLLGYPAYNDVKLNDEVPYRSSDYVVSDKMEEMQRLFDQSNIVELPGTKVEIANISKLLQRKNVKVDTLTGSKATESAIKQLRNVQILHIASHGFFRKEVASKLGNNPFLGIEHKTLTDNPLFRSGLLLAGCKTAFTSKEKEGIGEDGVLTAYEALSLNLDNTELVVLSAYETGLGEIQTGEGVYGLQRAFQTAGAKVVIMSLWKVDDQATQQLMSSFYAHWVAKGTIRDAFKKAQKDLRKKFSHPYYWGAFVLLGD